MSDRPQKPPGSPEQGPRVDPEQTLPPGEALEDISPAGRFRQISAQRASAAAQINRSLKVWRKGSGPAKAGGGADQAKQGDGEQGQAGTGGAEGAGAQEGETGGQREGIDVSGGMVTGERGWQERR
jgi:hypothetical protein